MGFTFEMFEADAELFVKDLINYSNKYCECRVGYVRDPLFEELRFKRPYFIIPNTSFCYFADFAIEEKNGTFSITYNEWQEYENREMPHISYCATLDQKYVGVLVQHLSISNGLICTDYDSEEGRFLKNVMLKYLKRYFYKAGRLKYKVYCLRKNK